MRSAASAGAGQRLWRDGALPRLPQLAAVLLVRRTEPGNLRRAVLAGGLVLLLPVHIYMSAMLSEEILASTFAALCITAVVLTLRADPATQSL